MRNSEPLRRMSHPARGGIEVGVDDIRREFPQDSAGEGRWRKARILRGMTKSRTSPLVPSRAIARSVALVSPRKTRAPFVLDQQSDLVPGTGLRYGKLQTIALAAKKPPAENCVQNLHRRARIAHRSAHRHQRPPLRRPRRLGEPRQPTVGIRPRWDCGPTAIPIIRMSARRTTRDAMRCAWTAASRLRYAGRCSCRHCADWP